MSRNKDAVTHMEGHYQTRDLYRGAYLIARGLPWPEIQIDAKGRAVFQFADPDGTVEWESQELDMDNQHGDRALISAPRLFISIRKLREAMHAAHDAAKGQR